jgi:FixJ family two-component response regulator
MTPKKIYVAVVDDDDRFARAIGRLLRASGLGVHAFSSAEAFLGAEPSPAPECLVLDVHLGGISGVDLQKRLRQSGNPVPIIFVTAHDSVEARDEATQDGCIAYLRKPVAGRDLFAALAKALPARSCNTENWNAIEKTNGEKSEF